MYKVLLLSPCDGSPNLDYCRLVTVLTSPDCMAVVSPTIATLLHES